MARDAEYEAKVPGCMILAGESSGWAKAGGDPPLPRRASKAWRRTRAAAKEASTARDWLTRKDVMVRVDGAGLTLSWSAVPQTWYRNGRGQARYGQGRMIGVYGVPPFVVCIRIRILPACPPATLKIYAYDG